MKIPTYTRTAQQPYNLLGMHTYSDRYLRVLAMTQSVGVLSYMRNIQLPYWQRNARRGIFFFLLLTSQFTHTEFNSHQSCCDKTLKSSKHRKGEKQA